MRSWVVKPTKKYSYTFGILTTPAKDIFHSNYHRGLLSGIVPRVKAVKGRLKIIMMPSRPYKSLDQILTEHGLDGLLILTWRWIHPSIARLVEKTRHPRVLVVNDPVLGLRVNIVYTDTDAGMAQAGCCTARCRFRLGPVKERSLFLLSIPASRSKVSSGRSKRSAFQ